MVRHGFSVTAMTLFICPFHRLALLLAIIYLASQAFPIIFQEQHGFAPGVLGLTFIGMDIGFLIAMATQPFWNRYVHSIVLLSVL